MNQWVRFILYCTVVYVRPLVFFCAGEKYPCDVINLTPSMSKRLQELVATPPRDEGVYNRAVIHH